MTEIKMARHMHEISRESRDNAIIEDSLRHIFRRILTKINYGFQEFNEGKITSYGRPPTAGPNPLDVYDAYKRRIGENR